MESCVVYHLKFLDCNVDYIGKTSKQIIRKFEKHKSRKNKDKNYDSSCHEHRKTFNHKIDYDNFIILTKATTYSKININQYCTGKNIHILFG